MISIQLKRSQSNTEKQKNPHDEVIWRERERERERETEKSQS